MNIRINNELDYTELVIEEVCEFQEDYQLAMIRENQIPGLLKVQGWGVDQKSQYSYDISGLPSMKERFEKEPITEKNLRVFLGQLFAVLEEMRKYMLDINRIVLDPMYIFLRDADYQFCYLPSQESKLTITFHGLTEYFIKAVDYGDTKCVVMACELHKVTMEERYNLRELLKDKGQCESVAGEEEVEKVEQPLQKLRDTIREPRLAQIWKRRKKPDQDEDWMDFL